MVLRRKGDIVANADIDQVHGKGVSFVVYVLQEVAETDEMLVLGAMIAKNGDTMVTARYEGDGANLFAILLSLFKYHPPPLFSVSS